MKKKTLKEIFEFFPEAEWITSSNCDGEGVDLWLIEPDLGKFGYEGSVLASLYSTDVEWGNRITIKQLCVSRKETI